MKPFLCLFFHPDSLVHRPCSTSLWDSVKHFAVKMCLQMLCLGIATGDLPFLTSCRFFLLLLFTFTHYAPSHLISPSFCPWYIVLHQSRVLQRKVKDPWSLFVIFINVCQRIQIKCSKQNFMRNCCEVNLLLRVVILIPKFSFCLWADWDVHQYPPNRDS